MSFAFWRGTNAIALPGPVRKARKLSERRKHSVPARTLLARTVETVPYDAEGFGECRQVPLQGLSLTPIFCSWPMPPMIVD